VVNVAEIVSRSAEGLDVESPIRKEGLGYEPIDMSTTVDPGKKAGAHVRGGREKTKWTGGCHKLFS